MFDIWKKLILVTYGRRSRRLPERRDESEREGVGERASGRWKSFVFVRAATSRVVGEERGTQHFFTALSLYSVPSWRSGRRLWPLQSPLGSKIEVPASVRFTAPPHRLSWLVRIAQ